MRKRSNTVTAAQAQRWAHRLMQRVQAVLAAHPDADPDNVRHTFILLEHPPLERLHRSLIRGRSQSSKNKRKARKKRLDTGRQP